MKIKRKQIQSRNKRRGVAAVEAAICIVVMFPILFATLEICNAFFLQESLTIAAYEGARTAARQDADPAAVRQYVNQLLNDRGVDTSSVDIRIDPANFENQPALDPVTVTIDCQTADNSVYVFGYFANRTLTASVSFAFETGPLPANLNNAN